MKNQSKTLFGSLLASSMLFTFPFSAYAAPLIKISESSNLKTVSVSQGSKVQITLHSTYWASKKVINLEAIGAPISVPIMPGPKAPQGCQFAGTGCGSVTWSFIATKTGSASFEAGRTSCGEALKCTASQQKFKVFFKVK
jgi:hypothetical protein